MWISFFYDTENRDFLYHKNAPRGCDPCGDEDASFHTFYKFLKTISEKYGKLWLK